MNWARNFSASSKCVFDSYAQSKNMKFGLRFKFTAASIFLVIFVALILSLFFIHFQTFIIHRALVDRGMTLAMSFSDNAKTGILSGDSERIDDVLRSLADQPDVVYASAEDPRGIILAEKGLEKLKQSAEFQQISKGLREISEAKIQFYKSGKNEYYDIALPVLVENNRIGTVRLGLSLVRAKQFEITSQRTAVLITGIILLGAGLGTILLAGIGIAPVQRLVEGTNRIASGNFDYKVSVSGSDEIAVLADSFNKMSGELRKSHQQLLEAKEYTDNIIKSMLDMLVVVDAQGIIRRVNPATTRTLGYDEDELLGHTVDRIFVPQGNASPRAAITKKMLKEGKLVDWEMDFRAKSGKNIPVLLSGSLMVDRDGNLEGIVGIAKDIFDRKKAEQSVRESNERFYSLAANMPGMIYQFVLRQDGFMYFSYISLGCRELFGLEPDVLQKDAMAVINTIHPDDRNGFDSSVAESAKTLKPWRWEGRFYKGKEIRWIQGASRPKKLDNGDVAWDGLLMDISERKVAQSLLELKTAMLEKLNQDLITNEKQLKHTIEDLRRAHEELKETQFQLHQAEKLKTIGRLASGVAHEVKNPLAIILQGITYVSKKIPKENTDLVEILNDIKIAVHRADEVIKGMLDFSSISALSLQLIDIHQAIEASLSLLRHELEQNHVEVIKVYGKDLPEVKVDKNKMEQVIVNVLLNSVQAMAEGGTITVRTYLEEAAAENLGSKGDHELFGHSKNLVIAIENSGPSIPEGVLKHIFDPFFTTKIGKGGTGLGLPIIRNILELHKGKVEVENRAEGGVRTKILLKV